MGPKKKGKDKDPDEDEPKAVVALGGPFTEVEKTFLESELAQTNRKVARLRTALDEYEKRNEELQKAYDKLDEDRADIIAYLKKTLNVKNEENNELKDKVKGLEETREIETAQFKQTVAELEKNFSVLKDQLTSENKLLTGKLNTLEEFRAIRDDLMKKFEKQEQDFKDQEMKYKRIIYDAEKKFVIGKDKLKKEMEARLLQLAQDFQDVTELRIAASTHRVIRENIAINNELDSILASQSKLSELTEKYKVSEKAACIAQELAEEERDKAINNNIVQLKVINQLTSTFQEMKKEKALYEKKSFDLDLLQSRIEVLTKENENLSVKVRLLEQNLHARMTDQNKSIVESSLILKESEKLKRVLKDAANAIKAALKMDEWSSKGTIHNVLDRKSLLTQLLEIITQYRELHKADSTETLASLGGIYKAGDLGFIPKISKIQTQKPSLRGSQSSKSKESQDKSIHVEKSSSAEALKIHSPSLSSLKTIPSIRILSSIEKERSIESIPSFVTSTKSTVSSSEGDNEDVTAMSNIEQQLEASKLEIQKSILKDLQYAQLSIQSQMKIRSDKSLKSKSSFIKEAHAEETKDDLVGKDEPVKDKEGKDEAGDVKSEKDKDLKEDPTDEAAKDKTEPEETLKEAE